MKRLMIIIAAMLFAACQPIVAPELPKDNVFVKNSAWETVRSERFEPAKTITSLDALNEEIEQHNTENTDDQWMLFEGEAPSIEEAPTADAWIVDAVTYKRLREFLCIARVDLEVRRDAWRDELFLVQSVNDGRPVTLYVDNEPPAEIEEPPPPVTDPYVIYATYIIGVYGDVLYEHHSADAAEYAFYCSIYTSECFTNGQVGPGTPWRTHFGSLYVKAEE